MLPLKKKPRDVKSNTESWTAPNCLSLLFPQFYEVLLKENICDTMSLRDTDKTELKISERKALLHLITICYSHYSALITVFNRVFAVKWSDTGLHQAILIFQMT